MSEMARCNTTTQNDFNFLVVEAAIEKQWNIVDALFQRDIQFSESALQTILLEAFKQKKKYILYGLMYSPFINLEKCILHGIENSEEDLTNYILRHFDHFNEIFISETFKSAVKSRHLRIIRLLISQHTSYSVDLQTILEAREISTVPNNVGQDGKLQNISSLLNQRLDIIASELTHPTPTKLSYAFSRSRLCFKSSTHVARSTLHLNLNFHMNMASNRDFILELSGKIILNRKYSQGSREPLPSYSSGQLVHADLLCILGREVWRAEFTDNCIKLKGTNSDKTIFLRRLQKQIPHLWYYQDDNGIWEEYRNTLTSEIIDNCKFQNQNKINFQINKFSYEICLNSMTQKNNMSGKIRNIKRRPKRSYDYSNSEDCELHELLPPTWDLMKPLEVLKLVKLSPHSSEYLKVFNRISNQQTIQSNTVSIDRIQNPYLWRSFQNRLQEMKEQNCNPMVLKLFHCTSEDYLNIICQENIDYRQYVNRYSYGAHFSQTINHAKMNAQRLLFINGLVYILAHVAVGTITTFNPNIIRPPISPATNFPYDTAVDNELKPNLYVKYESQEYYPEYIIRLKN
ncbi:unnamed protein product, partial [Meganyctiphanes norvegica]